MSQDFTKKTKLLIDNLKGVCASYGLGNDGNEFKIITQVFLYKFMNDKFGYELKLLDENLKKSENWEQTLNTYSDNQYEMLLLRMSPSSAKLKREHFLSVLHNKQNEKDFATIFDSTLRDISILNNEIFSVKTDTGAKIRLFDELSQYITDSSKRDNFCRAIINQLVNFSFEEIFSEKFDFFSTIFEYLIKDYNKDGGGKYAEYYTPHAVSKIMASILVNTSVNNVTCYDPAAGSGTLLMNLAHAIGEDKCTLYSQDISQKSSSLLRLNLILNNLVHSINNIIQGNTILEPYFKSNSGLMKFNYIVSNPPFNLDFGDFRNNLDSKTNRERFFAGIPNIPDKKKDSMAIYLLFIQHIIFSLDENGKAAIVVPTGFLTTKGISKKIRKYLVDHKMLKGLVSMPSNIFATTATSVSILFIDKTNKQGDILLMDASKLGTKVKDGNNQKTLLSNEEEQKIIEAFNNIQEIEKFSVLASYDDIASKDYSFSPGQYFEVKREYVSLSNDKFKVIIKNNQQKLNNLFLLQSTIEDVAMIVFDYWFTQFDFPNEEGHPYSSTGGKMAWNKDLKKEIPLSWEVKRLGSVLKTTLGGTPDTNNLDFWENGDIPWLSSGETDNFPIISSNTFITKKGLDNSPAVLLPKGSVVISIVRYIRVSLLGIDAATNQSVVGISETKNIRKNFLFPFLKSQVPTLMSKRTGAQQPHINKGEIDNIYLIIPPENVLNKYYEITQPIYDALINYKLDYEGLTFLKDNFLPHLIDGQVSIND